MYPSAVMPAPAPGTIALSTALERIAERATRLDRAPRFPAENFDELAAAGVLTLAADRSRATLEREVGLVRAVAAVDASTARILDGHFNGVERLALLAAEELRDRDLAAVERGELLFGVWGADPVAGEGPAAALVSVGGATLLRGVKTFCSGAGGVQRALVVASAEDGARRVAYLDTTAGGIEVDREWYRASGLRSSESHRVEFLDTPVLAVLGSANELTREPYLSRDGVRTAATWAGIADRILAVTVQTLAEAHPDDLRLRSLGRMRLAMTAIELWLANACRLLERPSGDVGALATQTRLAVADGARLIATEAALACGSRALVDGGTLDRCRRDLDLFLLQHRLDPKLVELGRGMLDESVRS